MVQAYNHQAADVAAFDNRVESAFKVAVHRIRQRAFLIAMVMLLIMGAIAAMLWVGGQDVLQGRTTAGERAAFVFYALIVAGSVGAISEVWLHWESRPSNVAYEFSHGCTGPRPASIRNTTRYAIIRSFCLKQLSGNKMLLVSIQTQLTWWVAGRSFGTSRNEPPPRFLSSRHLLTVCQPEANAASRFQATDS